MAKKIYKISGMDCPSCAKMIELDLEDIGINAKCNFAKNTLEIEENGEKNLEEKLKSKIADMGYKLLP